MKADNNYWLETVDEGKYQNTYRLPDGEMILSLDTETGEYVAYEPNSDEAAFTHEAEK